MTEQERECLLQTTLSAEIGANDHSTIWSYVSAVTRGVVKWLNDGNRLTVDQIVSGVKVYWDKLAREYDIPLVPDAFEAQLEETIWDEVIEPQLVRLVQYYLDRDTEESLFDGKD